MSVDSSEGPRFRLRRELGRGAGSIVMLADDRAADRPGLEANRRLSIRSPLRDAGFTKADVRAFAGQNPQSDDLTALVQVGTNVSNDPFSEIVVGLSRMGAGQGITGSGTLAVFQFQAIESPIEL